MYLLTPFCERRDGPQPRGSCPGRSSSSTAASTTTSRGTSSRSMYVNYPASIVEQIRNQISLGAIKALIIKLGGLREGRKALILVSEGYTNYLPAQLRSPNVSMPGAGNPIAGNEAIRRQHGRTARAFLQPGRDALGSRRMSTTLPTRTTSPSTRWTRAGWPCSSTTSMKPSRSPWTPTC